MSQRPSRSRTFPWSLSTVFLLGVVAGCSGLVPEEEEDDDEPQGAGAADDVGQGAATAAFDGFAFDLFAGDFWRFAWSWESTSFAQGSGASSESATGQFVVTLGASAPFGSSGTAFELLVEGDTVDPDGHSYAPRWQYLALEDGVLLGSLDGSAFRPLFDASGAAWSGGGFFSDFGDTERDARLGTLENEFVDATSAVYAGVSVDSGGCQFFHSIGQLLCPDEEKVRIREEEYFKGGVGPFGYLFERSVSDDGGGFFTSFSTSRELGLVETNLTAIDGFQPQLPPWNEIAPMPGPRLAPGAVGVEGELWVFGGSELQGTTFVEHADVQVYDPQADTWRAGPSMPSVQGRCSAAAFGTDVFVFPDELDGVDDLVDVFDVESGTWTSRAIPGAVAETYGTVSDLRAAFVSGSGLPGGAGIALTAMEGPFDPVRAFYYDPVGGEWYFVPFSSSEFVFRHAVASFGAELFLVGGIRDANPSGRVVRLDTQTGAAAAGPGLVQNASDLAAAVVDGRLLAIGGLRNFEAQRSVEALELPSGAEWRAVAGMPGPRMEHSAAVVGGRVYVVGGYVSTNTMAEETFVYDPSAE